MEWKSIVGTVAPWLAGALSGPLGAAAVSSIADALGLSDKTEDAIKVALSGATPEQMLAIKVADQEFQIKMQELGLANVRDMEALGQADRDSARQREASVKDNTPRYLAYAITSGFFGVLVFMMFKEVPQDSRDIMNIMLGSLGASWTGVVAYYFGSSRGSVVKTDLLAKADAVK